MLQKKLSFINEHPIMAYGNQPCADTIYSAAAILLAWRPHQASNVNKF